MRQRALLRAHPRLGATFGAAWQPLGPSAVRSLRFGTVSGRVTALAVDPGDPSGNTVYLGSAGGGVWKSTGALADPSAVRFTPLTDTLPVFSNNAGSAATASLSIGALTAGAGGLVLAGTGDPNDSSDSYYGGGILRSEDGGVTWSLIPGSRDGLGGNHSFIGLGFAGFAWSTTSPSLVVAAVSQSVEGTLVNAPDAANSVMGLYYSTDAGVTWQMATLQDGSEIIQSPLPNGGNHGGHAATAVVWNPVRQRFFAAIRYHGYYESADGLTWTRLRAQPSPGLSTAVCPPAFGLPGAATCPIFRGALAVDPATGDTFALTVDNNNHDTGLSRDICNRNGSIQCAAAEPTFAAPIVGTPLETSDGTGTVAQGDYNLTLYAASVPGDTILFAGAHDLFRCSVAQGCALRNTTNADNGCNAPARVAPAQHSIVGATARGVASPVLFFGNDGGLWRSTDLVNQQAGPCTEDDAAHFQNLNGSLGSLAEVVSFAQDPEQSAVLLAGMGAAGTAAAGGGVWAQLSGGEGGTVAIDPADPSLWYLSTGAGVQIALCGRGAACTAADVTPTVGPTAVGLDDARLDAPWLLDPGDPTELLVATCRVWRGPARDGSVWSANNRLSPILSGAHAGRCDVIDDSLIRALAAGGARAPATASAVLYAGISGASSGGTSIAGHVLRTANSTAGDVTTPWTDLANSPVTNDVVNRQRFNPGAFDISSVTVDSHDPTGATLYVTVLGFTGNGVSAPHVYRSADGGAHWLNISSNLPNAPASSVAVDPNDANTVYVALDTGVYATSSVTDCVTSNCWTVLGTALPNAPALQLAAAPGLPTGDGRRGELRVATAGRGLWQIPLLTARADAAAAITLNPAALSFASRPAGTLSAAQTISVANTGAAPLTVSRLAVTGDFQATTTCIGATIAVGAGCLVQVTFLPAAAGTRTGLLTLYANVAGGQSTVALNATATTAAAVTLTPLTLSFPTTSVNGSSAVENIVVANTGAAATALGPPAVTGDFLIAVNTCGATLAASTGCTVGVLFTPHAAGTRSGLFSLAAGDAQLTAALGGSAAAPPTDALSTAQLGFGPQPVGSSSSPLAVILTNAGDQPLALVGAQVSSGNFSVVNSCGNVLAGHSTCALGVAFNPHALGTLAGTLTVADEFRSQTIALSGIGVAPAGVSLAPTGTLSFATTPLGSSSPGQALTLTNNGGTPVSITGLTLTGDFALATGSTCAGTVAPQGTCTANVLFTPTATGARTGTLTLTESTTGAHTVNLTGSGLDFTLTPGGQTSAIVNSGSGIAFPLLLTSDPGIAGSASIRCTGAPANGACVVTPSTAGFGGTTLIVATVSTGTPATIASLRPPRPNPWRARNALSLALVTGALPTTLLLLRGRRRRTPWPGLLLLLVSAANLTGCSTGRTLPPSGAFGDGSGSVAATTPPGTYALTVTVTSAGLSRHVDLTLTVQ